MQRLSKQSAPAQSRRGANPHGSKAAHHTTTPLTVTSARAARAWSTLRRSSTTCQHRSCNSNCRSTKTGLHHCSLVIKGLLNTVILRWQYSNSLMLINSNSLMLIKTFRCSARTPKPSFHFSTAKIDEAKCTNMHGPTTYKSCRSLNFF